MTRRTTELLLLRVLLKKDFVLSIHSQSRNNNLEVKLRQLFYVLGNEPASAQCQVLQEDFHFRMRVTPVVCIPSKTRE